MDISAIVQFLPFIFVIVIFYFLLIRPQQKQEKAHKKMLSELKTGDQIVTIGGIMGKIVTLKEDCLTIETGADHTKIKLQRWAIKDAIQKDEN